MPKKFFFISFLILSVFAASTELFAQRINEYPSRVSSSQNYSYYRYHRIAVSNPVRTFADNRSIYRKHSNPSWDFA